MIGFFKRHRADICLVALLLLLAGGAYLFFGASREAGAWVVVTVDGVERGRYPLGEARTVELNGGTNVLRIEEDQAWLLSATCPDKLCVHQGKIQYSGQVIVCLPNKLTVTIQGVQGGFDLVS